MTDKKIRIILDSKQAEKNANDLDRSMKGIGKTADGVGFAMKGLAVAISAALVVKQVLDYADAWTMLQNQLKRTTSSQEQLTQTSYALLRVANDTRNELATTVDLYTSLSVSTKSLNLSQEQTIGITKTINNLFLESGKSAAETAGAVRQLGQALQSGALRGDEFNSVAEGAPGILRAIQAETGKTAGQLRELAADGKISAELIVRSLQNYSEAAQDAADKTNVTLSQAFTVSKNNLTAFIGTVDTATGASNGLANALLNVSNRLVDPSFLSATDKFIKAFGQDFALGVDATKLSFIGLFDIIKAGFTDASVDAAIEKTKRSVADLMSATVQRNIDQGIINPQSNMRRPGNAMVTPEKTPAAAVTPTKEELAEAKKAYRELLDIQSEFWDAVDEEARRTDAANREVAAAQDVTAQLKIELDKRRQLNTIYASAALAVDAGYYEQKRALIQAKELESIAETQAGEAEKSQRRSEQLRLALDNENLEASEKLRIKQEYDLQEQIQEQINQEQLIAIRQQGKTAREELDRAEFQTRLDSAAALGNALIGLGQGQSKKIFKIGQTLALAQAAVALPTAVMESFKNGGGYPWGLVPAAAMLATGLKNIQQIKSAGAGLGGGGGGGSVGASLGGGGGSSSLPSTSSTTTPFQQKQVIEVRGIGPDSLITGSQLVDILQKDDNVIVALNGAQQDAQRRGVI